MPWCPPVFPGVQTRSLLVLSSSETKSRVMVPCIVRPVEMRHISFNEDRYGHGNSATGVEYSLTQVLFTIKYIIFFLQLTSKRIS